MGGACPFIIRLNPRVHYLRRATEGGVYSQATDNLRTCLALECSLRRSRLPNEGGVYSQATVANPSLVSPKEQLLWRRSVRHVCDIALADAFRNDRLAGLQGAALGGFSVEAGRVLRTLFGTHVDACKQALTWLSL